MIHGKVSMLYRTLLVSAVSTHNSDEVLIPQQKDIFYSPLCWTFSFDSFNHRGWKQLSYSTLRFVNIIIKTLLGWWNIVNGEILQLTAWSVTPAGYLHLKCGQMLTGAPALSLWNMSGYLIWQLSALPRHTLLSWACVHLKVSENTVERRETGGITREELAGTQTEDVPCTGRLQGQIKLQTGHFKKKKKLPSLRYSLISISFLKARGFFSAGKIQFSVRWMQLRLSNSCWSVDVSGRCPSCHLI